MSKTKIINDPYESDDSQDPDYIPSQTPESEDFTSQESSSLSSEWSSESEYSIADSQDCSGSSDLNSSFYDESDDSQKSG